MSAPLFHHTTILCVRRVRGCAAGLALLLASLEARSEKPAIIALALPTPTPAVKAKVSAKAVESRSKARILAKGIDPADPNIKTRLEALAAADLRTKRSQDGLKVIATPKASFSAVSASSPYLSLRTDAGSPRSHARVHKSLSIGSLLKWMPEAPQGATQVNVANFYLVTGAFDPGTQQVRVQMDLGACGQIMNDAWLVPKWAEHPELGAPYLAFFPYDLPTQQQGQLKVVADGVSSNSIPVKTDDSFRTTLTARVTIASGVPHFSGDGGVGLGPGNMQLLGGPRVSTTPDYQGGTGGAGIDELGIGVYLVNGYTATARIVRAHSFMDAAGYGALSDGYRSAAIQEQPQAGRLLTKVAWSYVAGESIEYEIEWTLTGSPGKRPLGTMPKPACGS